MTRAIKFALVYGYVIGAALTFNFAYPIGCEYAVTRTEFRGCVMANIESSAVAASIWPAFWTWELTR